MPQLLPRAPGGMPLICSFGCLGCQLFTLLACQARLFPPDAQTRLLLDAMRSQVPGIRVALAALGSWLGAVALIEAENAGWALLAFTLNVLALLGACLGLLSAFGPSGDCPHGAGEFTLRPYQLVCRLLSSG